MIALTKFQKDLFLDIKKSIQQELLDSGVDYVPIEAENDIWILPEEILEDKRFIKLNSLLDKSNDFGKYEKRHFDNFEIKDYSGVIPK